MADWRKFIGKKDSVVAVYIDGGRVHFKDRELACEPRPGGAGWYRFEIEGRTAKAMEPADPVFEGLAKVRGVLALGTLFAPSSPPEYVELMPPDEPLMFASCTCYRWHSGDLVFGELDFEGETEETARAVFAERGGLEDEKGMAANLRGAFAWATVKRASTDVGIPCSAREAWPHANDVASKGHPAAVALLDRLDELRHGGRIVVAGQTIRVRKMVERAVATDATIGNAPDRAREALEAAGARVTAMRRLAGGYQIEASFTFGGERFISIADSITLQVVDAGICLVDHHDGHRGDRELTLDSLPAAIREAMDLSVLVITRR